MHTDQMYILMEHTRPTLKGCPAAKINTVHPWLSESRLPEPSIIQYKRLFYNLTTSVRSIRVVYVLLE